MPALWRKDPECPVIPIIVIAGTTERDDDDDDNDINDGQQLLLGDVCNGWTTMTTNVIVMGTMEWMMTTTMSLMYGGYWGDGSDRWMTLTTNVPMRGLP